MKKYRECKITDIEWYESKNTPFGSPHYFNRPPAGYFILTSPIFGSVGLLYNPDIKESTIYHIL